MTSAIFAVFFAPLVALVQLLHFFFQQWLLLPAIAFFFRTLLRMPIIGGKNRGRMISGIIPHSDPSHPSPGMLILGIGPTGARIYLHSRGNAPPETNSNNGSDGITRQKETGPSSTSALQLAIHSPLSFLYRVVWAGARLGLAESYMAGEWDVVEPTTLKQFLCYLIDERRQNCSQKQMNSMHNENPTRATRSGPRSKALREGKLAKIPSLSNYGISPNLAVCRRNVQAHYDLGNDLFRLFLDPSMTYSCALFSPRPPTHQLGFYDMPLLTEAQANKCEHIIDLLELDSTTGIERGKVRVFEIGCGWGALGKRIRERYPQRVEWIGVTLSEEQYHWATEVLENDSLAEVKLMDYRSETGWHLYDRIVAVEMIEAVGPGQLPAFFRHLNRLLKPGGILVLQAITCPDALYPYYSQQRTDFIRKHVFPGGYLPSLGAIRAALPEGMRLITLEEGLGRHYEPTLDVWCAAWLHYRERIQHQMGYSREFFRKWEFYFSLCSALFSRGNIDVAHLVITKA